MSHLGLAITLARRELRDGAQGFRLFLITLALGVAAVAGIGSLSDSVSAGLQRDGRTLLGGDISLSLRHTPATAEQRAYLDQHAAQVSAVSEMRAMAQADGASGPALVELKGVDNSYPLAGDVLIQPRQPLSSALATRDGLPGAVVDGSLLNKLGIAIGDTLRLGKVTYQVRAQMEREPDRVASVMRFGPRLMVHGDTLAETGLVQPGSQIRYRYRVALPGATSSDDWRAALDVAFPDTPWRVRGTDDATPGLKRFIDRLSLFLTFVGLTALLVGGVGVSGAVRAFLDRKRRTIATLKCMGAPAQVVFLSYLLQVLALASLGVVLGLAVGAAVPFLGAHLLADVLPVPPVAAVFPLTLIKAAAFGYLTTLCFALWPLLRAGRVPASALFRARLTTQAAPGRMGWLAVGVSALALALFTIAVTPHTRFAIWFVCVTAAVLILLFVGSNLIMRTARRVGATSAVSRKPLWRLVLSNLHRPGSATPGVVQALGVGLTVLVAVGLIQHNLAAQVDERLPDAAPAFFFIDIQPHQVDAFEDTVLGVPQTSDLQRMPSLRGRIAAINGTAVEDLDIPPGAQWAIQGDRALTYTDAMPEHAKIVAGSWWPADYAGPPLISFDAGLARAFDVGLGDTLTLNILGRDITATIGSLRDINWRSLRFDFAIIFAPGTLEGAPHSHIAAVQAPTEREVQIERAIADAFPNISAIRVRDALEAASSILAGVGQAVRGTAAIAILAGLLVLGSAVAAGAERRTRDAVIFKVLGARTAQVRGAFLLEYGLLGLATGVVAAAVGTLIGWAVVVHVLTLDWAFSPATVAVAVAGALTATLLAGFAGTARALHRKAAPYLRNA